MHRSFIPLFLIAFVGVMASAFVKNDAARWVGVAMGLVPLFAYHVILWRNSKLAPAQVDSVYYFGFLVTVVTLVATAIAIGQTTGKLDPSVILTQFGLGLIATGYALFARLMLLSRLDADPDTLAASAQLALAIERVALQMNDAGYQIETVTLQTQERMRALEERLGLAERAFQENIDQASLTFHETLARSAQSTVESSGRIVEGATAGFAAAVHRVSGEMRRLHEEANGISFERIAESIVGFSEKIKLSIEQIASTTSTAGIEAAGAISELTSAARKLQRLTQTVATKLGGLEGLEEALHSISNMNQAMGLMVHEVQKTAKSLEGMASTVSAFEASLLQLKRGESFRATAEEIAAINLALKDFAKGTAEASNSMLSLMAKLDSAEVIVQERIIDSVAIARMDQVAKTTISSLETLQATASSAHGPVIARPPLVG